METLRSILVPIDGSPASLAALDYAVALANDYGARIDILHVIAPRDQLTPSARAELDGAMNDAVYDARMHLGDRVDFRTVHGEPLREIVEAAESDANDLIVVGTHGQIGRIHAILGSVAEGVVRNAPCPVLTVRDSMGGHQSFAERRHGRSWIGEQRRHH